MTALIATAWSLLSDRLKAAILAIGGFLVGLLIAGTAMHFAYEGLSLPFVGQVIDGRVQSAVKAATSDLVNRAEYDALAAVIARKELDAQAAAAATAALRARITTAEREKDDAEKQLEDQLAADGDRGRSVVNDADLRWMHEH